MTNPPPPELFPQRPVRSDFTLARSYRIRRMITCLVLVGLIGGGAYEIYIWKRAPTEIPTIKAEGPLKQKPEQPGGIDIPNQDVLAYQQIDNSGNKTPPVEHLLPPPETPQAAQTPTQPPAAPNAATSPAPAVETLLAPAAPAPVATTVTPDKPKAEAPANIAPPPDAAPRSAVVEANADNAAAPAPSPPVAAEPKPAAPAPQVATPALAANDNAAVSAPTKAGKKGFRVQLASFPDEDTARHQMAHMEKKFATQLGEAKLHLAKTDLGPRGIYYRVQSNPITDIEARDICGELKKIKAGCIVVKP